MLKGVSKRKKKRGPKLCGFWGVFCFNDCFWLNLFSLLPLSSAVNTYLFMMQAPGILNRDNMRTIGAQVYEQVVRSAYAKRNSSVNDSGIYLIKGWSAQNVPSRRGKFGLNNYCWWKQSVLWKRDGLAESWVITKRRSSCKMNPCSFCSWSIKGDWITPFSLLICFRESGGEEYLSRPPPPFCV